MENESLLRTLQEAMRKLTESGIACAASITQLREKGDQAQLAIDTIKTQELTAVHEHERIAKEVKALRDHVNDLVRGRADSTLIAILSRTAGEEAHRRLSDRTMGLREHIERVAHV